MKTKKRVLAQRGVLWMGQTCNLRCYFCYFLNRIDQNDHPEHPFMSLEKATEICKTLRTFYGNTSIDIQGGEPTIHPDILELIRYCRSIGLHPTLITNGLVLGRPGLLEQYKEAGVRDFLVSLHGIGEIHDQVVCKPGAYEKIVAAIERMRELNIPFRFNCTMSKPVIPLLPAIAQKAIDYGALVVNYIAFNPFEDQDANVRTHENVPKYSEIKPMLTQAMDLLEKADIEVNVRYIPLCVAEPRHRKNFYNFQQLPYDLHEWDYQSWMWTGLQPQRMRDGGLVPPFRIGPLAREIIGRYPGICERYQHYPFLGRLGFTGQHVLARLTQWIQGKPALYREEAVLRAHHDAGYRHYEACHCCALRKICDGFHSDYATLFGSAEAVATTDLPLIDDPLYFIRDQEKVVESEEAPWAI